MTAGTAAAAVVVLVVVRVTVVVDVVGGVELVVTAGVDGRVTAGAAGLVATGADDEVVVAPVVGAVVAGPERDGACSDRLGLGRLAVPEREGPDPASEPAAEHARRLVSATLITANTDTRTAQAPLRPAPVMASPFLRIPDESELPLPT